MKTQLKDIHLAVSKLELFDQSLLNQKQNFVLFKPYHNILVEIQDEKMHFKLVIIYTQTGMTRQRYFEKSNTDVSDIVDYLEIFI